MKYSLLPVACLGVVLLVMLTVLYVLSSGPAFCLVYHGYLPPEAARTCYYPLRMLSEEWEPVRETYDWYTDLFLPSDVNPFTKP